MRRLLARTLTAAALGLAAQAASASAQDPIVIDRPAFERLAAEGARIVDARAPEAFARGHIPGAVNLPWMRLNIGDVDGIKIEFAPDADLAAAFGAAGLSYDDAILIVDETSLAGRAFVAFDYAGFDRVRVLDGGMKAWDGPLSAEAAPVAPTDFALTRARDMRVGIDHVASRIGAGGAVIVDGRGKGGYDAGHIPTAVNVPAPSLLRENGAYQGADALRALLAAKGVTPDREVVNYCASGVYSAHNYLAMRNLGYKNVWLYDASMDEWGRDPARVEK